MTLVQRCARPKVWKSFQQITGIGRGVNLRNHKRFQIHFKRSFLIAVVVLGEETIHVGAAQAAESLGYAGAFVFDTCDFIVQADPIQNLIQPVGTELDRADNATDLLIGDPARDRPAV
ncbi:MAG: hypothetical protein O3C10_13250 [Chloroflexi bacterium]|nr:hypothetical protein [Chloroflexota bacterium]